jgi:malate dehydrogenase (oxaloacetate-decarboxylating)
MAVAPSASYSLTVRLEIKNRPGMLGRVASAIGQAGGDIGAVDLVQSSRDRVVPSVFNKAVAPAVADGVARAAHATGVARRRRRRDAAADS